ncbi:MAG: wax ester/triacylglycerol synthase family O-acyltransferase [Gammaproteobacteria bacterium]|nr:wax ester/triacylglycerol synthase family O-acyltransferase [Gammaproteobacteria bacterium]
MKQLSGLDAIFLNLETNAVPMHVGGLAILDPSTAPTDFGIHSVKRLIEQRLHLLPSFRRRLVASPLNLDQPYWIEDPEFDLESHVRHRALPRPGTDRQLADFVCDVMSTRLDRSMPLWRFYYIEGLQGGRVAVLAKIHHACIDGVSGAEIMSTLLDLTPEPRPNPPPERPWVPDPVPTPLQLVQQTLKNLATRPGDAWRLLRESAPVLVSAGRAALAQRRAARQARDARPGKADGLKGAAAPRMLFNTTITARRAYAFRSVPLADVKQVKNSFGVTVNDVVLAVSGQALRDYLLEKRALPDRSLIAAIPVSVRAESDKGTHGNKIAMARAPLGTHIADPAERLRAISQRMGSFKRSFKASPARLLMDWANVPAPAVFAQAARLFENFSIQDYVYPPFNLVVSNVPGPPQPLYLAGARVLAHYPVSIPYHGLAFNITVMSYQDNLDIGLTAHRGTVPDVERVMELMVASLERLKEIAAAALKKAG